MRRLMWMGMVLAVFGSAACSSIQGGDHLLDREITGEVLFESYSIDQTWTYKLSGMYIAADGTVWEYERVGTPWYPEKLKPGELYERDMLSKHKDAQQIGTVDRTLLRQMADMIKPAARGHVARSTGSAYGNGALDVAYLLDPTSSTYHEIILAGYGERAASNDAPEARMLLDYLHDVQRLVHEPVQ